MKQSLSLMHDRQILPPRIAILLGMVCLGLASANVHAFQKPAVRIQLSEEEIYLGDKVECAIDVQNIEGAGRPNLDSWSTEVDIQFLEDFEQSQQSITIVNGRMNQIDNNSHIYKFQLTPKRSGTLTLPSIDIQANGRSAQTPSLTLRVVEPEKQDLVLIETQVDPPRVYPTQPFKVTLNILVKPLPDDSTTNPLSPLRRKPPKLMVNWVSGIEGLDTKDGKEWLQSLLARNGVGFSLNDFTVNNGFFFSDNETAVFDLYQGRETRTDLSGQTINYFKYTLTRTFTGRQSGLFTLGPATIKGTFVSGIRGDEYIAKRLAAIAPAISVEVREVPAPRPATYCGGIGNYTWKATATPSSLRIGDPLTLTLEAMAGPESGSIDLLSAPNLGTNTTLLQDFELIDEKPTGRVEGQVKKFSYAMRPKRAGVRLPEIIATSFDPSTEMFIDVQIAASPITVTEATQLSSGELVGAIPATPSTDIKTRQEGIFQNLTDPGLVRDQRVAWTAWTAVVAGLWSLTGLIAIAAHSLRNRRSNPVANRRLSARKMAMQRLAAAVAAENNGNHAEGLRLVKAAILNWIADVHNLPAEGLTSADVSSHLSANNISVEDRNQLLGLLDSIDASQFGGGERVDLHTLVETARDWLARPGVALERKNSLRNSKNVLATFVATLAIAIASTAMADTAEHQRSFLKALEQFDSANGPDDYAKAAETLESIVASGVQNGAVYYNLGNAYYRCGQFGRAILNYRKAIPYLPRDPYLHANLRQAIAASPGKLAEPPGPWWQLVFFWSNWFSFPTKAHLALGMLATSALFAITAILWQRRILWIATGSLLVIGSVMSVEVVLSRAEAEGSTRAVIVCETIARKGMGSSYEAAFDQPLRDGAEFEVLSQTGEWTLGHFQGIGEGWIRNDCLAR